MRRAGRRGREGAGEVIEGTVLAGSRLAVLDNDTLYVYDVEG